ncbi:MAG: glycosyltransferase family 4 protein [bacterium]|nr:glycosyltransferase family 4 protein [bacterium]
MQLGDMAVQTDRRSSIICGQGVIAYGITPHAGGTTTFYRNFAAGMREKGWVVWGVSAGKKAAQAADPAFGDGSSIVLVPNSESLEEQVKAFLRWVEENGVDIVIPMCQSFMHAAIRHLPSRVRVCVRVANTTRGSYMPAIAHRKRASRILVSSLRQRDDLIKRWDFAPQAVCTVNHGVAVSNFERMAQGQVWSEQMSVAYFGRLEDQDKGVLLLPAIFSEAALLSSSSRFLVIGDGPDRPLLEEGFRKTGLDGRVELLGKVVPNEVPAVLASVDIFLMPSRFEGFGFALLEAMAAGCVPVASRIRGVTDFIIEDGVSGFLCPIGDTRAFAQAVLRLDRDRELLARMSAAARRRVEENFTLQKMVDGYDRVFRELLAEPPLHVEPAPLTDIRLPRLLSPTWRTRVPQPLKNFARKWMERLWGYAG